MQGPARACFIAPAGNIVASHTEEFRESLLRQIEQGHRDLVIQLDHVEVIDSRGLAVFELCHQTLAGLGGSLTVVTSNRDLLHLFRVTRLNQHFTVCERFPGNEAPSATAAEQARH